MSSQITEIINCITNPELLKETIKSKEKQLSGIYAQIREVETQQGKIEATLTALKCLANRTSTPAQLEALQTQNAQFRKTIEYLTFKANNKTGSNLKYRVTLESDPVVGSNGKVEVFSRYNNQLVSDYSLDKMPNPAQ